MSEVLRKTDRSSMSRHTERASYDRELAYSILDEALVAHVGFSGDEGPLVLPMTYARSGARLYLHGAAASRWLSSFERGRPVSVCVTLLDGIVLARSAFSHSLNYRSVVAFGNAVTVTDAAEKMQAFHAFMEHIVPGRWEDSRQPNKKEINATTVLALDLDEASIKVRSGQPKDTAGDYGLEYWAGVIPLVLEAGEPLPDPAMEDPPPVPVYATRYRRP